MLVQITGERSVLRQEKENSNREKETKNDRENLLEKAIAAKEKPFPMAYRSCSR